MRTATNGAGPATPERGPLSGKPDSRLKEQLAGERWGALESVENTTNRFIQRIEEYLPEINRRLQNLATRQSAGNPGPDAAATARPSAPPAARHPIEDARAEATATLTEIEVPQDRLIEQLTAIGAAHTDPGKKKIATDKLTLARFATRKDLEKWRRDITSEDLWRVNAGVGSTSPARQQLEQQITSATKQLQALTRDQR